MCDAVARQQTKWTALGMGSGAGDVQYYGCRARNAYPILSPVWPIHSTSRQAGAAGLLLAMFPICVALRFYAITCSN